MFSLRRQNIPPLDLEAGVTVSGRPLPISAKFIPSTMSPVLEVQPPAFAQSEYYSLRPATEYLQALAKPCMFASWTPSSRASLLRPRSDPASSQADAHAFQVTPHGAKSCYPGERIVARRGRAMMFIALWLTGARRNYFAPCVWLRNGLFGAKPRSDAPLTGPG